MLSQKQAFQIIPFKAQGTFLWNDVRIFYDCDKTPWPKQLVNKVFTCGSGSRGLESMVVEAWRKQASHQHTCELQTQAEGGGALGMVEGF